MPQFSSLYGTRLDRELGSADRTQLFTTALRQGAINEGVQEFAVQTKCMNQRGTVTLTHGVDDYNLTLATTFSTGFLELAPKGIEYRYLTTNGTLTVLSGPDQLRLVTKKWLDENEPGWQNSSATSTGVRQDPRYYVFPALGGGGQSLMLHPPPGRASTNDSMSLVVYYIATPSILSSDTQIPFLSTLAVVEGHPVPRVYHQAAVHYAAYQLEKLRRDTEASEMQLQKFLAYVARYMASMRQKGGTTLTYARNYFRTRSNQVDDPRT